MIGLQDNISDIELKQRWRLYWIQTIFEFSSLKFQELSWLKISNPELSHSELWDSSLHESLSAYFDTLALDDAYEQAVAQANVTQEEAQRVKTFHHLIVFYDEPEEHLELVLQDSEWLEVVEAAKEFWDYLKESVTSQREIDLIKKLEKDFN